LAPGGEVNSPSAGNYACVRDEQGSFTVLSVGASNDLSAAATDLKRAFAEHGAALLFTRLNVSASVREAEQRDISAYYGSMVNHQRA
jgi:hypothetical protein